MELRHLRYFSALADSLNFTRAAERLHVTQSTLSHQIKQLEDEVGTLLFDRTGKRVALTEAGEAFLHHATRALREIDRGLGALRENPQEAVGELRIGSTPTFNVAFIPDCIASFQTRYPGVRVVVEELAADLIVARLQDGSLDLGIAYRPGEPGPLQFEPLYNEEMVLVVAHGHPLARRKRVRMVELHRLPMVLLPASFATRQMLDECFRTCGAEPYVAAEINALAPIMGLVAKTQLASIVAANAVLPNSGLDIVRLESPTPVRTPGMLWSPPARESEATRAFSSIVRKVAFRTRMLERDDGKPRAATAAKARA
ncbi:LysR substrate-binding domain-containing protein [Variovorax sp. UMC13]|uniref:LysR substrate-binding domain-containing protein n=1 Tax=Variovorax sp. UMC13 TaxID=1862326 RepID=UPI001600FC7B|nr:LysR substrate-binding domain-containing protein [Variovorax sp. UMC13]MBB1600375.1 LysR family transcriptional regulator [Variovorax sp. UMC13]